MRGLALAEQLTAFKQDCRVSVRQSKARLFVLRHSYTLVIQSALQWNQSRQVSHLKLLFTFYSVTFLPPGQVLFMLGLDFKRSIVHAAHFLYTKASLPVQRHPHCFFFFLSSPTSHHLSVRTLFVEKKKLFSKIAVWRKKTKQKKQGLWLLLNLTALFSVPVCLPYAHQQRLENEVQPLCSRGSV